MIGILAVQGAFAEHGSMLDSLGVDSFEIRAARDLGERMDGMIIPGGESTVMGKILDDQGMTGTIREMIGGGLPVFGTCAGLILLSESVQGGRPCIGTMPIQAVRNAYGRQLGSFSAQSHFGGQGPIPMEFIRAPAISRTAPEVEVLAEVGGRPVAARYGRQMVTAFHPELTDDTSVHRFFLESVVGGVPGAHQPTVCERCRTLSPLSDILRTCPSVAEHKGYYPR
ncbi:MAG: pyridoxal 5'-phosphate synthase glutaminase subunit PdxT [Candidatus Methanomethylophilaceae archaeon]|jgi:5'-phosphate synthase pdxT subunit|nr:pyridoxal 5'-phosphate synthase glutaminase subunit PdxT [Candidatus Methanomethylophilaceae archaeon]